MRLLSFVLLVACATPSANDEPQPGETGSVDADGDGVPSSDDCDDENAAVFPGNVETPRNDVDDDCDPATCHGVGFPTTPTDFTLPGEYGADDAAPFDQLASYASCTDGTPAHLVADVSGDGRLDLLVSFVCGDDEATGDTRWLVHAGAEGGFVVAATDWTLPNEYGADGAAPFANATAAVVCGDGIPAHFFTDLTGDGLPDLVITQLCDDDATGRTQWLVHAGTPTGFADAATTWALPAGYGVDGYLPFSTSAASATCAKGIPGHTLTDLTGDGAADLVVTQSCTDTTIGDSAWAVYPGTGAGFAAAATAWTLPSAYVASGKVPFSSTSATASCGEAIPGHDLQDLDGDALPDLVVTESCADDPTVGDTRWLVYRGQSGGFADAAADWALPTDYGAADTTPFSSVTDVAAVDDDTPAHTLYDLDGDGVLDLLIEGVPSQSTVGSAVWSVHFGGAAGFTDAAWDWTLPPLAATGAFTTPRTTADCGAGTPAWALSDLDGDTLPELVLTDDCTEAAVGDTRWTTYEASCAQ